jgi:hypothetical protein
MDRLVALTRFAGRSTRHSVSTYGLLVVFIIVTVERVLGSVRLNTLAIDLRIYRAAAEAAIAGRDPWAVGADGLTFAAPPPTLLPYLPAALLPEGLAIALYGALSLGAALLALRAVRLPLWWLLFPPIVDSLIVLNPDVVVIALVLALPRLAAMSIVLKIYAAVPLAIAGRWRPMIAGLAICLLSLPWLPAFLASRDSTSASLAAQSYGGLSAWGTWLMVPTVIALLAIWRRGAEWLSIPALWPYTQLHYAALALPVAARSPVVAFLLCFPVAFLPPIATILYAAGSLLGDRFSTDRSGRAGPNDAYQAIADP